ncbi:MAG: YicC family protein [Sandaracinus sp.]|nr:YicC family protein [Sandaracinus sp.]|tara:strand:+ start:655 stop:1530 length:876 start_codon:yes stop_codon:yes gene_type:complete
MTGYGIARRELPTTATRLTIDVRSLNHRFLDVRTRCVPELQEHVAALEAVVRKRLHRGRVEVGVKLTGRGLRGEPVLDVERARTAYAELCRVRDELAPGEAVPLTLLASVPDLYRIEDSVAPDAIRELALEAIEDACDQVEVMRLREGQHLAQDLSARLEAIRARTAQLHVLTPSLVDGHRDKMRERIRRLLDEQGMSLDEGRLEHEVAVFADRADVAEELARLRSHCDQFVDLMQSTGPTHGRKLDFLLQEMAREVNTIGSKISDADITRLVVEMKADVERMREQVQNIL